MPLPATAPQPTTMSHLGKRSFVRFLLVGGTATALQYAIMFSLLYAQLLEAGAASATGYCMSTLYNYWANALFTFGGGHNHRRSLPRFLVTALVGLGINQLALLGLSALFHFGLTQADQPGLLEMNLHILAAQVIATGCVLLWNYFINATWSFRSRRST